MYTINWLFLHSMNRLVVVVVAAHAMLSYMAHVTRPWLLAIHDAIRWPVNSVERSVS